MDLNAERLSPVRIYFLSPPPSLPFPCSPKQHCKCECTQRRSSGFRYPRRAGLAELTALYEVTILAVGVRRYPVYVWLYLDVGPAFGIFIFPIVSSRVFCSARPLSDVAASQGPSVAAAAEFLYSPPLLGCKFLSTVLSLTVRLSCSSCRKSSTRKWRIALSCSR